jgi:hypothetical protein
MLSAAFSASSGVGRGTDAGSILFDLVALSTSGNGTLLLLSKERRGDLGLTEQVGVKGGVSGNFNRFVAVAPNRWSGVMFGFVDVFGVGALFLTARGILEGLEYDEIGVERPRVLPGDFGVEVLAALNANLDFSIPPEPGMELASFGVGGCSAELVADIEVVKLGVVS